MGDSWFQSVPGEKSIRRYGDRFKCIVKMAHALFPKAELDSLIEPFPGVINLVMGSVDDHDQKINDIGYK